MAADKAPVGSRPGRLRRALKLLARCLFWLVFALVAGVLFVLLTLPSITDFGPIRNKIARVVSQRLRNATISMDSLRVDPLRGKLIEIRGLTLAAKERPDKPIVQVEYVACHWSPLDALHGTICVTGMDVQGASVHLVQEKGRWNIDALAPTAPPVKLPFSFKLWDISARDVSVEMVKESGERTQIGPVWFACEILLDHQLCGSARLWCSVEHARAQMPLATGVAFSGGARMRASVVRKAQTDAIMSADCTLRDALVELQGVQVALPPRVSGNLTAELDLAHIGNVQGEAALEVSDMARHHLTFRVERGDPWRLQVDSVTDVDVARVGEFLRPTVQCLSRVQPFSRLGQIGELSLAGHVKMVMTARGEMRPSKQPWLNVMLTERVVGSGLGLATSLRIAPPGHQPLDIRAKVEGLDITHDCALAAACGERVSVSFCEMADIAFDRISLSAGDLGRLECRDLVASRVASGELPRPVSIKVAVDVAAGALSFESPKAGKFETPFQASVKLQGTRLTDPERSLVLLEDLNGSVGAVLPSFELAGLAQGYGSGGLQFGGDAILDLAEVRRFAGGVSEKLVFGKPPAKVRSVRELIAGADVAGVADVSLEAAGRLPRADVGGLEIVLDGEAALERLKLAIDDAEANVGWAQADFGAAASLGPRLAPSSVSGRCSAEIGRVRMATSRLEGGVEGASARLDAAASGEGLKEVSLGFSGTARGLSAVLPPREKGASPLRLKPVDVRAGCSARLNLQGRDILVEDASLVVPQVLVVNVARLEAEDLGSKRFAASGSVSLPDLRALLGLVPEGLQFSTPLPEVSGSAALEANVQGRLPLVARMLSATTSGTEPSIELFPIRSFYETYLPVSGSATLTLSDVSVRHRVREGFAVSVSGISSSTHVRLSDGDVEGDSVLSVPEVRLSVLRSPLTGFQARGAFKLEKFDRLLLTEARLSALEGVLTCSASGEVSGLSQLRGVPTPAAALRLLNASASGGCKVTPEAIGVIEGWKGSGGAGADFNVRLRANESLRLECAGWLDELNVSCPRLFNVQGLSARVPFRKEWRLVTRRDLMRAAPLLTDRVLDREMGLEAPGAENSIVTHWVERGFDPAAVRLLSPAEGLSVRSVSVLGRAVVENVAVAIQADAEVLRVPRASLNVLGGRVLTRMAGWRDAEAVHLYLESGFDGLDMRQMLPPELRDFSGDASISGILRASGELRGGESGAAGNPIKDVSGTLDVRHIGSEALDRALLVLDPKAQNPAIVQIRGRLTLARPSRVVVKLERGFMSIDVELEGLLGQVVSQYPVPRFSVAGAFESQAASRYMKLLSMLTAARKPLDALAAGRVVLNDKDGSIEFLR